MVRGLRVVAAICGVLAVVVLGAGSIYVGRTLPASPEDYVIDLYFAWPLTVAAVWLLGSAGLVVARWHRFMWPWLVVCLLGWLGLYVVGAVMGALLAAILAPFLPHNVRALNNGFVGVVLLIVETGIVYCGWRFVLRSHITTPSL